jgi:hypothetical protein
MNGVCKFNLQLFPAALVAGTIDVPAVGLAAGVYLHLVEK